MYSTAMPFGRNRVQHTLQSKRGRCRQSRRGLIEDEDLRLGQQRAGDLEQLLVGKGQRTCTVPHRNVQTQLSQDGTGQLTHAAKIEQPTPTGQFGREEILRHRQVGEETQLLRDDGNSVRCRFSGVGVVRVLSTDLDGSRVPPDDARQDLDHRRLPSAVLPDECMDLAGVEADAAIAQRMHATVGLGEPSGDEHVSEPGPSA